MPDAQPAPDARPLAVVCDFDGTIVTLDIGDEICKLRAPEAYAEFDSAWSGGKMTLIEGQRWIWPRVRMSEADFRAAVETTARLRDGFARFFAAVEARGTRFLVASNGFANYIELVLGGVDRGVLPAVYANRLEFAGDRITPRFPFLDRYGCGACGVCKGLIVDELKAQGFRVAFMGDGGSDRCAAGRADHLFAVAGASFERFLRGRGFPHTGFRSFDEVSAALGI